MIFILNVSHQSPFMSKVFKLLIQIEIFLFIIVQHKSSYNLAISTQSHQEKVNINLNVIWIKLNNRFLPGFNHLHILGV